MRDIKHFGLAALVMAVALTAYFGVYLLVADYVDCGSNSPLYLVRYRIGPVSLHRLSSFFEPARRIDDLCFRHRHGIVMDWATP